MKDKKELKKKLRLHLMKGGRVSSNQALRWWRTNRIAIYVCRLRKEGLKITTKMVSKNGDTYAVYSHEI